MKEPAGRPAWGDRCLYGCLCVVEALVLGVRGGPGDKSGSSGA